MPIATLLASLLCLSAPQDADSWPRAGGPSGDGQVPWPSEEFRWPSDGPEVLWRTAVGPGFGGASIEDGQVFLLDRERGERDVLRVFDLTTGEELWQAGYLAEGRLQFRGSRTTPTVVGQHVYTTGGLGRVACFDRELQALAWSFDLEQDFDGIKPMFGWSTHPLVVGDLVYAAPLGKGTSLVALERKTGEVVWRSGHLGYSHSTPALLTLDGRPQLVFVTCPRSASGRDESHESWIWSLDPETGSVLWKHSLELTRLPVPPPVRVDDTRFFVTGGYRSGSTMLELVSGEDGYSVTERFHIERGAQVHPPLLVGEHLYLIANENWNHSRRRQSEGGLMCLGLDGEEHWRTGAEPFFGRGGSVAIGDTLLVQDGVDGTLRAIRATPDGYSVTGSFDAFGYEGSKDRQLWAQPAVASGCIVMRSQEELVCLRLQE